MARIPAGPLLLVSPHLDDAVLSCEALVARRDPIDVLTVAAGAPDPPVQGWWDRQTGFASSAESVQTRLLEDEAAFAGTPHRRSYLPVLETQHQRRGRTREDEQALKAAVRDWVDQSGEGIVALPAGAGFRQSRVRRRLVRLLGPQQGPSPPQHPDHVWVRDVVLETLRGTRADVLLYEEFPYLFGSPADAEAAAVARRLGSSLELVEEPVDRETKARRIAAYASQIPHLSDEGRRLDDPTTVPERERYWLLRAPSTSA